jgi:SAM-dependent methyltransferase
MSFKKYAEFYDTLYSTKDYVTESDYVSRLVGNLHDKRMLDIGSGTGGYSEQFVKTAKSVHGIDASEEMILIANKRKSELDADLREKLSYELADARTFASDSKFDVAYSLFHVINYLLTATCLTSFFQSSFEALNSDGLLVFDFWYGPAVISMLPTPRSTEVSSGNIKLVRSATPTLRTEENQVDVEYNFRIENHNVVDSVQEFSETHSLRYLFKEDLEKYSRGMFSIEKLFAWNTQISPTEKDWSAVCVMRKI